MLSSFFNRPSLVYTGMLPYRNLLPGAQFAVPGDSPSRMIRVPTTVGDFIDLGIAVPNHLYLCQEPSGNLTDSFGGLTLTANGSPTYANAVTGWTRLGLGFNETANQRFQVTAGSGPNPASTSVAWLCFFDLTGDVTATNRRLVIACDGLATTGVLGMITLNGGQSLARLVCVNVGGNGTYDYNDGAVHPFLLVYDRTNALVRVYTDKEQLNGTYATGAVDAAKGFGAAGSGNSHLGRTLYGWAASGTTAESYGKTTLSRMGWQLAY